MDRRMSLLEGLEVACFDLFDTLVRIDTERLPVTSWEGEPLRSTIPIVYERLFASRGVQLEELLRAVRSMWREVSSEMTESAGGERWREIPATDKYRRVLQVLDGIAAAEVENLAQAVAQTHHEALVSVAVAVEGAEESLQRVRKRGLRTVLISNWDYARASDAMLAQTGLAGLLDHVVISEAVGLRKPHPAVFTAALAPHDIAPSAALHVGDLAEADAWGAARLGFRTVWIDRRGRGWPEGLSHPPALIVQRLAEILPHL